MCACIYGYNIAATTYIDIRISSKTQLWKSLIFKPLYFTKKENKVITWQVSHCTLFIWSTSDCLGLLLGVLSTQEPTLASGEIGRIFFPRKRLKRKKTLSYFQLFPFKNKQTKQQQKKKNRKSHLTVTFNPSCLVFVN